MTTTAESPTFSVKLRALDPDLPMLAAAAAMELDNYRSTGETEFTSVISLSKLLKGSFAGAGQQLPSKALLDSSTVSLVGRALNSRPTEKIATIDQLSKALWRVAEQLEKVGINPSQQPIEAIRDFCVSLSELAASYRQALHDLRPAHPARR